MGVGNKRILKILLKSSNRCFYCKVKVKENRPGDEICKAYSATVDHKYYRNDIRRNLVKEKKNVVLSCYDCNQKKALIENSEDDKYHIISKNVNVSIIGALIYGDIGQTY